MLTEFFLQIINSIWITRALQDTIICILLILRVYLCSGGHGEVHGPRAAGVQTEPGEH